MKVRIVGMVVLCLILNGCVRQAGRDFVQGGLQVVESKLIELRGADARKAIANALAEGFKETDIDPNLDGIIDWEEWKDWQKKVQVYIFQEGAKEYARTGSIEATKAKIWSLEQRLGLSGGISALAVFLLNMFRNRTRKKDLDTKEDKT